MELTTEQRKAMDSLMDLIHPKLSMITDLTHCIRLIIGAKSKLELRDIQDEKLASTLIDLYAVIKDTAETYEFPSGFMESFDEILKGWNRI